MSIYDYISDESIRLRISRRKRKIHHYDEREEFENETYLELYDFMPFDRHEVNEIIDRVYRKYSNGEDN